MKIIYSGRHIALAPSQTAELETEFAKISKVLDGAAAEAEAHIFLKHENLKLEHHLNQVKVKVTWRHHEADGEAEHKDLFAAIHAAVARVSAQVIRQREKARDLRRVPAE